MQQANGTTNGSREMIDSVKQLVGQLEAELRRQQEEIAQLRAKCDDMRAVIVAFMNKDFDPAVWDNFNPDEFKPYTMRELIASLDLNSP
jgi:hypothetical protein